MIDAGATAAIASTVGVTALIAWRFFAAFNSKTDTTTTERIFKLTDVQTKDIAGLGKDMAVMGRDVQHLTTAIDGVGRNVEEILKNGKRVGG